MAKPFAWLIVLAVGTAYAGDSRLVVTFDDYAYLPHAALKDLNYAQGFTVEVWFRLPHQVVEGRYGTMVSKGRLGYGTGGWFIGATTHDYFESFGHSADSSVFSMQESAAKSAAVSFPGIAGDTYVVTSWDAQERLLTTSVNGVVKVKRTLDILPASLANNAPFVVNGNAVGAGPPFPWGGRTGEYYLVRLWNRPVSAFETDALYEHTRNTKRHALPSGFAREGLVSEWRMEATCDALGRPGTTHLCDTAGPNHLRLSKGARLERGNGALAIVYPPYGATSVGASVVLQASGGRGEFPSGAWPIQYLFEIDVSPAFDSAALKKSGWLAHVSEWQPVLEPAQEYYWRVKARDSSALPRESSFTAVASFTTRPPRAWYVRPRAAPGTYGRENGRGYAHAFNGSRPANRDTPVSRQQDNRGVIWGPGGVEAGDTLFIAGKHYMPRHSSNIYGNMLREGTLYVGADGYSMDDPITIRMDAPEEKGEVWNFGMRSDTPADWAGPDKHGVYHTLLGSGQWQTPIAADVGSANATIMKQAAKPSWVDGQGKWFVEGRRLYVKMPDGKRPDGRVFESGLGAKIAIQRRSFIKFKHCNFYGVSFEDYLGDEPYALDLPDRAHHISFENTLFEGGNRTTAQVTLHEHNDHWVIRNSTFRNYKNGIYGMNYPDGGTADHATVEGNDIRYMANGEYGYSGGDAHAVGVQNGSGWLIEGNSTQDTGTAIELWAGITNDPSRYMENHIIRRNRIFAARNDRFTTGTGIAISGKNGDSEGQRRNIRVHHNLVFDVDGYGIASNNPDPVLIANNTIVKTGKAGIGILLSGKRGKPKGQIVNNLLVKPGAGDYLFLAGSAGTWPGLIVNHNCYQSKEGQETFYAATVGRVRFQEWRQKGGFDPQGFAVDTRLVDALNGDFSLREDSPCIDAGTASPYHQPIHDLPGIEVVGPGGVFHGKGIDIGAFETPGAGMPVKPSAPRVIKNHRR